MAGRRENVALLALALERTVHVDADAVSAHSRLTALVVVLNSLTDEIKRQLKLIEIMHK